MSKFAGTVEPGGARHSGATGERPPNLWVCAPSAPTLKCRIKDRTSSYFSKINIENTELDMALGQQEVIKHCDGAHRRHPLPSPESSRLQCIKVSTANPALEDEFSQRATRPRRITYTPTRMPDPNHKPTKALYRAHKRV